MQMELVLQLKLEDKRELWQAERRVERTRRELRANFSRATELLVHALDHDPENRVTRMPRSMPAIMSASRDSPAENTRFVVEIEGTAPAPPPAWPELARSSLRAV